MLKASYLQYRKDHDLKPILQRLILDHVLNACLLGFSLGLWFNYQAWPFQALSILATAVFMFRNFSLMHDATHGALTANHNLNEILGIVAGTFCFLPFEPWKQSHLQHHYWSGNVQKDPVMAIAVIYPKWPQALQKIMDLCWRLWLPLLAFMQYGLFWLLSIKNCLKKPNSLGFWSVAVFVGFWSSVLLLAPGAFLFKFLLPSFVLYLVAVEIVNFPHHLQMEKAVGEERFQVWDQYRTARTCLYPKWFAEFVVLNFNYHAEHHMYPEVPWYHLPLIHQFLKAELGESQAVDPYFKWNRENRSRSLLSVILGSTPKPGNEFQPENEAISRSATARKIQ